MRHGFALRRPIVTSARSATLWLTSLVFVAGALATATHKYLWHDELYTLYIADRPTAALLWQALADGTDLNPPLYYLLVRACRLLPLSEELAVRLPAIAGFSVMGASLYALTARPYGSAWALFIGLIPALSGARVYATEGRPYGLMLGLAGLAALCWARRAEPDRTWWAGAGLAATAALLPLTHYYGIAVIACLCVADLLHERRPTSALGLLLVPAAASTAALLPLIRSASDYSTHFWARPSPGAILMTYRSLTEPLVPLALFVVGAVLAARVAGYQRAEPGSRHGAERSRLVVLAGALSAVPLAAGIMALQTGAYTQRYGVAAILGLSLAIGTAAFSWVPARAAAALASAFLLFQTLGSVAAAREGRQPVLSGGYEQLLRRALSEGPRVVGTDATLFLELQHYERLGPRFALALRPVSGPESLEGDTMARNFRALARIVPVTLAPYEELRGGEPFVIFGTQQWLHSMLLADGHRLELLASAPPFLLFRTAPAKVAVP
jgi:hypothetical protein